MFKPKTFAHLASAMQTGATVSILGRNLNDSSAGTREEHVGLVNAIEREDGSGYSYVVTLATAKGSVRLYVRLEQ